MRVILAGGGTGGHIYPAITLAKELKRRDPQTEILFVGGKKGLESDIVPKEGFDLVTLSLEGIPRRISLKVFKSLGLAAAGVVETFKIIRQFKPDLVVGTGGYVCGPMVLAASMAGIPTAIQEQNAFPGWTNRMLGKVARRVFLAYPEAAKFFAKAKIKVLGNPIRTVEFTEVNRQQAEQSLGIKAGHFNILIFGGSQSARRINQTFIECVPRLLADHSLLQVIMMTGKKDFEIIQATVDGLRLSPDLRARLHLKEYFYKIAEAYVAADLVLARAGAISLAEITCFGIPALLIPYPFATNNHQEFNARALEKNGAAKIILESELNPAKMLADLDQLINHDPLRAEMRQASLAMSKPQAAADIVSELLEMAKQLPPRKMTN